MESNILSKLLTIDGSSKIMVHDRKTPYGNRKFFCFLSCIGYTKLVNIMSLSGTHHKKEPLWELGSKEVTISALCSFLYILDMTAFPLEVIEATMYKKLTFYTYAQILI